MQHIAKEGRCFVISVNQFCKVGVICLEISHADETKVSDFPSDYPPFTPEHHDRNPDGQPWAKDDILNHGGSCILGPLGTFIAEPVYDKEEIIYATLNLSDLTEAKVRQPNWQNAMLTTT